MPFQSNLTPFNDETSGVIRIFKSKRKKICNWVIRRLKVNNCVNRHVVMFSYRNRLGSQNASQDAKLMITKSSPQSPWGCSMTQHIWFDLRSPILGFGETPRDNSWHHSTNQPIYSEMHAVYLLNDFTNLQPFGWHLKGDSLTPLSPHPNQTGDLTVEGQLHC